MSRIPETSDGRQLVVASRFGVGIDPYICGSGDDLATPAKGMGPRFEIDDVSSGSQQIEFGFLDMVRIAAGGLMWQDAVLGDRIDMWLSAKAAPLTANAGNGNCNIVSGVVVPAAGDGSHDVDLAATSVVPASGGGYWDYDMAESGMGVVSPSASPGAADWHILAVDQKLVHWVCNQPMLSTGEHYIDPQSRDRKIWPRWTWYGKVWSETNNASLRAAWYLNLARKSTI